MTRYTFIFLIASVGFLPLNADAQVFTGDLVRVKTIDGRTVTGSVSEVTAVGLGLRSIDGVSGNISFDQMESLYRSIGRRSYGARTALIGGGSAVLLGLLIGASVEKSCDDGLDDDDLCDGVGGFAGLVLAVPLGLVGALVGFIAGSSIEREKWQEVSLTGMGSMSIEPRIGIRTDGYPSLGVQLVF